MNEFRPLFQEKDVISFESYQINNTIFYQDYL